MTPAALVDAIRGAGVQLVPEGELIRLVPPGVLAPDLRAALLAAKPQVLELLLKTCTLGEDTGAPCPACGHVHGRLDAHPCARCTRTDWIVALVCFDDRRVCSRCLGGA